MATLPTSLRAQVRRIDPRLVDLAVGLACGWLTWAASDGPNAWSPFPRELAVAAGVAGGASLYWRRRRPVTVATVTLLGSALSGNPFPAMIALFTAGARRVDAHLVAVTAAATLALAVPYWFDDGFHPTFVGFLTGFALMGFPVGSGMYVAGRRDAARAADARAARAVSERGFREEEARIGERARIAREMHDVLAHKMSLIALHAGVLQVNPGAGPEKVTEEAQIIRRAATQALDELRSVLGVLREGTGDDENRLTPQPGYDDIGPLVEASRAAGVPVTLDLALPGLPATMGRNAYRIVQEALTNVHKHSGGAATAVSITGSERSGVTVTVVNGRGPGAQGLPGSRAGLVGLGERVRLAGGTLDYGPQPDGGWRVVVRLPWTGTLDQGDHAIDGATDGDADDHGTHAIDGDGSRRPGGDGRPGTGAADGQPTVAPVADRSGDAALVPAAAGPAGADAPEPRGDGT